MTDRRVDQQLLLGLLGLQCALITRDQLVSAFGVWMGHKDRDLADIFVEQRALNSEQRQLLSALVEQHIRRHGNDPEASLRQLSSMESVKVDLQALSDPDLQASLACVSADGRMPTATDPDEFKTIAPPTESQTAAGRFVVVQPLASGGLGSVSIARDLELNRHVAFKQILPDHADNLDAQLRFKREAEITGGLEHPGIVPIYGLGTFANGRPFYAMKLIRGDSLKDAIAQFHAGRTAGKVGYESSAFRDLLRRLIDVCNAIQYAHDRGVLHRDLKPGNIMLGKYGETLVVDWGLAKPVAEATFNGDRAREESGIDRPLVPRTSLSQSGTTETQTGEAKGTPAYMSPEQARGDWDTLGPATDIYALGATLYSLLVGKPPIESTDGGEAIRKAALADWRPPSDVVASVPRALNGVCVKAMAADSKSRYRHARDLAADLEHWLADEPVSAVTESAAERWGRWGRQHRGVVQACAAGMMAITLISLIAVLIVNQMRESNRLLAEEKSRLAVAQSRLATRNENLARDSDAARVRAEKSEQHARARQYVAEMVSMEAAWNEGRAGRVRELLQRQIPAPGERDLRGWEWHFQNRISNSVAASYLNPEWFAYFAISRAGDKLAIVARDNTIRVHAVDADLTLLHTLKGQNSHIWDVEFHPNGKRLLSTSLAADVAYWDLETGRMLWHIPKALHGAAGNRSSFTRDGRWTCCGGQYGAVVLMATDDGPPPLELLKGPGFARATAISEDGRWIAAGSDHGQIQFWDESHQATNGAKLDGIVLDLKFDKTGSFLAACGHRGAAVIDRSEGKILWTYAPESAMGFNCIAISADGAAVFTGDLRGRVHKLDLKSGEVLRVFEGSEGSIPDLHVTSDALWALDETGRLVRWNLQGQPAERVVADVKRAALQLLVNPHENWFIPVTVGHGKAPGFVQPGHPGAELAAYQLSDGALLRRSKTFGNEIQQASLSQDGRFVVASIRDGHLAVCDSSTLEVLREWPAYESVVRPNGVRYGPNLLGISRDSTKVYASGLKSDGNHDWLLKSWSLRTGEVLGEFKPPRALDALLAGAVDPIFARVAVAAGDAVEVRSAVTGELTNVFPAKQVSQLHFDPSGEYLLGIHQPWGMLLWHIESGRTVLSARMTTRFVSNFDVSKQGKRVVVAAKEGIIVWDTETGQETRTLKGTCFTRLGDGDLILTADGSGIIRLYDGTPLNQ